MDDHRSQLYATGRPLSGGASMLGPRGLPCRYAECRAPLFAAAGMSSSLRVLREVARARDEHEQAAHGAVYRAPRLDTIGAPSERQRAAHAAGGRARWAAARAWNRKGREL